MNVTTGASSIGNTSDIGQAQTKSSSTQKTSEKSFDEEMKTATKSEETKDSKNADNEEKTSNKKVSENAIQNKSEKTSDEEKNSEEFVTAQMLSGELSYTDFKYHNESQSILSQNIQSLLNTRNILDTINSAQTIDYDSINMSDSDANFFANLVQNTDMSMQSIADQINTLTENSQNIQKNIQVSSVLMEKLAESLKTNQPFRINFDKDISVIIKVNKDGSLSANFIPGDKAVEQYLRNNISSLRQRFDDENLSYSELTYSNSREGRQNQRNKKENNNE